MRGRKPKPRAIKEAEGNPGGRALNDHEPKPPVGALEAPAWVDGATRKVWDGLVPIMVAMGVATRADVEAIGRYCDGVVLWQRAREFLHKNGSTYPIRARVDRKGKEGKVETEFVTTGVAQFPQVAEYRQLSKLLLAFESEFGLTASSRTRIQVWDLRPNQRVTADDAELDRKKRDFFSTGGAVGNAKVG